MHSLKALILSQIIYWSTSKFVSKQENKNLTTNVALTNHFFMIQI